MRRFLAPVLILLLWPISAIAQNDAKHLSDLLRIPEIMDVMREEGLNNGEALYADMFPGRDPAGWNAQIGAIYDTGWMLETYQSGFADALEDVDLTEATAFFDSDLGQRILALELTGRQALLDETISDLVIEEYHAAVEAGDPRLDLIRRYVSANALIEQNVEGALNSNFAFMSGMEAAGGFGAPMSDEQILNEIWAQEGEIRADTEEWLMSYLLMAYRPLMDDELEAYIAISETDVGQSVNAALFAAFDEMFNQISYALGQAVGRFAQGEDI